MLLHCSALESRRSMLCAIRGRDRRTRLPFSAWAAWAILECSSRRRWDSTLSRLRAEPRRNSLRTIWLAALHRQHRYRCRAVVAKTGRREGILATVTDADAMSAAIGGLGFRGEFVVVGVPGKPIQAAVPGLVMQRQSIRGWPSGTSIDSEDTLKFSEITGVLPLIETYPLDRAAEAYDRMMSGKARFRVVLETGRLPRMVALRSNSLT